ncbi:uncharacterized protein C8R40DRAFT_1012764, partial [Lentinula edodes]|uniref:uncharacterized protein n=1 Tax=Lentinula edodes TaxID=5353 RepID=UPI001E8D3129
NVNVFEQEELQTLREGVQLMIVDVQALYNRQAEASHHGRPEVISQEHNGHRGRPRTIINPDFLSWAYAHRSTSGISDFLGVSRATVRRRLLENNIAVSGIDPFPSSAGISTNTFEHSEHLEADRLDALLGQLRVYYCRAGIHGYSRMITGLRASNNNRGETVLSLFMAA